MAATKKRAKKRRAPRVSIPVAERASSASSAIAALDQTAPNDDTTSGDAAGASPNPSTTPLATSADADSEPREQTSTGTASTTSPASTASSSSTSSSSSAPAKADKKAQTPAKPAALTGNQFAGLNRDQLRTLVAHQHNEILELRAQVKKQERAAAQPVMTAEDLEDGVAELFEMAGEAAALAWGDECELDEKEKARMGRVWATPAAKLVERLTETNPDSAALVTSVVIAATATGALALKKGRRIKQRRAEEAAKKARSE